MNGIILSGQVPRLKAMRGSISIDVLGVFDPSLSPLSSSLSPQLRVSAIRLMHIVMVTKPEAFMETDLLKEARTRCISLFFKSLTSRADQVSTCARDTVHHEALVGEDVEQDGASAVRWTPCGLV